MHDAQGVVNPEWLLRQKANVQACVPRTLLSLSPYV